MGSEVFDGELSIFELRQFVKNGDINVKYPKSIQLLETLTGYPDLCPTLRIRGKVSRMEFVQKWLHAYNSGFESRPSVRVGHLSETVPDELIKVLLQHQYNLTGIEASRIENGHSIMMSIENLAGDLLEEYLDVRLSVFGWQCAWGSTIKAVDFCHQELGMLQVKNSDNSENSSSSAIRSGTAIKKWFRRFSRRGGVFNWQALIELTECETLSEDDFRDFSIELLKSNPKVLAARF